MKLFILFLLRLALIVWNLRTDAGQQLPCDDDFESDYDPEEASL